MGANNSQADTYSNVIQCCTSREEEGPDPVLSAAVDSFGPAEEMGGDQRVVTVGSREVALGESVCFGPQYGEAKDKRLAVSSDSEVRILRVRQLEPPGTAAGKVQLDFDEVAKLTLDVDEALAPGCMVFSDPLCSQYLVGALNPVMVEDGESPRDRDLRRTPRMPSSARKPSSARRRPPRPPVVRIWDVDAGLKVVQEFRCGEAEITCVTVSILRVYVADAAGCCGSFEKLDQRPFSDAPARLHSGAVHGIDADPYFVYSVGADNMLSVWDAALTEEQMTLEAMHAPGGFVVRSLQDVLRPSSRWGLSQGVNRGTKTPCGLLFVTGLSQKGEGLLMSWNLSTRTCLCCVRAHEGLVTSLAFGPYDNGPVITGGEDMFIRVWDIFALRCIRSLGSSSAEINAIAVEPQRRFYSLAADGMLKVWALVDDGVEAPAKSLAMESTARRPPRRDSARHRAAYGGR